MDDGVVQAARTYKQVGRAFASSDPDQGVGAEEAAYDALSDAIRKVLREST